MLSVTHFLRSIELQIKIVLSLQQRRLWIPSLYLRMSTDGWMDGVHALDLLRRDCFPGDDALSRELIMNEAPLRGRLSHNL